VGFLSVEIDFSDREALLIGAGPVGRRKLSYLLQAGAKVLVVEPEEKPYLADLVREGRIRLEKEFSLSFFEARPWVFIAVDDPIESRRLTCQAKARGLMVNAADSLGRSDFTLPALVDIPPLRLTVGTAGTSPALAAAVASELRERFKGHGALAEMLGRLRPLVLGSALPPQGRRRIFSALAQDERLIELYGSLQNGDNLSAERPRPNNGDNFSAERPCPNNGDFSANDAKEMGKSPRLIFEDDFEDDVPPSRVRSVEPSFEAVRREMRAIIARHVEPLELPEDFVVF
jgi:siroheme synthase-like protein